MKGQFFIVIGPTGSGKSTLMKHVISKYPELCLPYSYTTRTPRSEAIENTHYKFITTEEFKARVENNEFLEWAEYGGKYYGTLKEEVLTALSEGKVLLKEMEVQGARQAKGILAPDQLTMVFVNAGSWEEMEQRIRARAPMTDEEVLLRKRHFEDEMTFRDEADVVVENHEGEGESAKEAFAELIGNALHAGE